MVEHPDFVSPVDMIDTAIVTEADNRTNTGTRPPDWESYGSVVCEEEIQRLETTDSAQNNNNKKEEKRRLLSMRTAITVAMMTTAAGFACFENLLYIFVYAKPGISNGASLDILLWCLFLIISLSVCVKVWNYSR